MGSKRRFRKKTKQKKNASGKRLCVWCEKPVAPPRRFFCSTECKHETKVRSSSSYARFCLLKRDKGICANCGIDCEKLKKAARAILKDYGREAYWAFAKSFNMPPERKSFWDCHHKVAVSEGGGESGLDNLVTICYPCHKEETKRLQERKKFWKKQRKQHKITLPASSLYKE